MSLALPTTKQEAWKYTSLPPLVKNFQGPPDTADVSYVDPDNIVQKLGVVLDAGAPEWLTRTLATTPQGNDKTLWDLVHEHPLQGLIVDVPAGKRVENPVEVTIQGHDNTFFLPRTVFRLAENAELTIIEYHKGTGSYWNNRVTQAIIGPGAKLRHVRLQENGMQAIYTQNTHVHVEKGGHYEAFALTAGARLSRNEVCVDLAAEGASCSLSGVNLLQDVQHGDTTVTVTHSAPACTSRQFYRSILKDRAHGVFQGKIHVCAGADGTDGHMLSNALLLSEGAEMDTKPELEIYTDDVQCAHGATTGALDEESLFYMRTRGISEAQARALLMESFVNEVVEKCVEKCGDSRVEDLIRQRIKLWLGS